MPVALTTYSHSICLLAGRTPVTDSTAPLVSVSTSVTAHALEDAYAELPRALGQRGGQVDGVDPPVAGHVEAGQQVVGLRPREQVAHLARGDLVDLEAEVPLERRDPAVLLQPVGVGRRLDQPDRLEARRLPGLGLQRA